MPRLEATCGKHTQTSTARETSTPPSRHRPLSLNQTLVEEMDFHTVAPDAGLDPSTQTVFARVIASHHAVLSEQHAFDPFCGRGLDRAILTIGLAGVMKGASRSGTVGSPVGSSGS